STLGGMEVTDMTTKTGRGWAVACFVAVALAAGCEAGGGDETETGAADAPGQAPAALADGAAAVAAPAATLELERILRRVERGGATPEDADALAAILAEGTLPVDALDRAGLGLSRARED